MNKKLLYKTTQTYLTYSVLILLISAPVFYFICQWLYVYETDEVLLLHKAMFTQKQKNLHKNDIAYWNKYNLNVEIVADRGVTKDTIFAIEKMNHISNEVETYRVLWAPVTISGKKYTYIEKANLVVMEDMVLSITTMFLILIIILLAGVILILKWSAAKIWIPFYNTLKQIQEFEIDKNKLPKFIETEIQEFDSLNKSITKLIEKNTAIYKNQLEFIENATHELQTPLALFQSKIDTLYQTQNLTEKQYDLLDALNNDVSRLNRLNKNLLLLSKIENDSYFDKQPIIINNYIEKNLPFFKEQALAHNITITTNFNDSVAIVANPTLTEILINNLFINAIRHNVNDGCINIIINKNAISFYNTGHQTPLRNEKLFNRFYKSSPSGQGNGLGLAIVKKITKINQWQVSYTFENNQHNFTVFF